MSTTTRKRAVRAVAPVAGLLAAGLLVWQGSYAAFNATTTNQADAWSTGTLVLKNNGGGTGYSITTSTPVFNEANLNLPTAAVSKCLTVESTGSIDGSLRLFRGGLTGTNSAGLAPQVLLTVVAAPIGATANVASDCLGFPTLGTSPIATSQPLSTFPTTWSGATPLAVTAGTQRVAYKVTYTVSSTGTTSGDNALQGATAQADLTWEIQ